MATSIGNETRVNELLENLIQLDYDAIEAYQAAIDRIEDPQSRQSLSEFKADHERHTQNLGMYLRDLGETPPKNGDMKSILTKGKVVLAGLVSDKAILKAMKSNEDDTNTAYSQALERTDLAADVMQTLKENLADERRHRTWIEQRLAQL